MDMIGREKAVARGAKAATTEKPNEVSTQLCSKSEFVWGTCLFRQGVGGVICHPVRVGWMRDSVSSIDDQEGSEMYGIECVSA